jgi:ShK domain-like
VVQFCSPACQTCDEYLKRFYHEESEDEDEADFDQPDRPDSAGTIKRSQWGVPQYLVETVPTEKFRSLLDATTEYMVESVMGQYDTHEDVISKCENRNPYCTYWAAQGECEAKSEYMHLYCAPTCGTCDIFDYSRRCPIPEGSEALKEPGDLNRIFERIVTDPFWVDTYGPLEILSSPELNNGPWIVTLDNFLNAEECIAFIEAAVIEGYERSEDEAEEENLDGSLDSVESDGRTSSNSWCAADCSANPILKPVHERLEKLTGMPFNNSEDLQLLKYEVGQFYEEQ